MIPAMHDGGTAKQIARWAALGALFLIPLAPLFVANSFFFPFITGKAFFFRILVEVAVAGWMVLALLDREYRPRFSWVGAAAVGFVLWMFVADAFAPNAAKAFWSNFERMEGWVLLTHLLGFFFAASNLLRVERKWRAWFLTSLAVSLVLVIHALLQLAGSLPIHQGSVRVDASMGNSTYFAIYLLFNVFIALWLALTSRQTWLKWSLIALALVEAVLIFFAGARGTIIGLILALALAALLTALTAGRRARQLAVVALVGMALLASGFYLVRDSAFVQGSQILERVASISLADGATRFTIWNMALQGVKERPLTGWGQEGFNYVFNKYYDPSLYLQEPWFDRAHNAFIDWLSAGGLPAFLLYFSLFASALVLLWKSPELSRSERIALSSALVGYAVHNLFVFDNLYSYIYFFAILALIDSQVARPIKRLALIPELAPKDGVTYALPITAVGAFALIWFVNVPGMRVAGNLITALSAPNAQAGIAAFEELAARPSFAAQEVREQIISFAGTVVRDQSTTNEEKQRAVSLAVSEMQKQVTAYPSDARGRLQFSYAYRLAGDVASALREIEIAIALSPSKEGFWIEAGATKWDMGDLEGAREAFQKAYELGPQFPGLAEYAAAGAIAVGDLKAADKILLDAHGTTTVGSDILSIAYYRTGNWPRLIDLWASRASAPTATADTWFSLAAAYYKAGDKARAIATIRTAMERFPSARAAGSAAIEQIEAGQ